MNYYLTPDVLAYLQVDGAAGSRVFLRDCIAIGYEAQGGKIPVYSHRDIQFSAVAESRSLVSGMIAFNLGYKDLFASAVMALANPKKEKFIKQNIDMSTTVLMPSTHAEFEAIGLDTDILTYQEILGTIDSAIAIVIEYKKNGAHKGHITEIPLELASVNDTFQYDIEHAFETMPIGPLGMIDDIYNEVKRRVDPLISYLNFSLNTMSIIREENTVNMPPIKPFLNIRGNNIVRALGQEYITEFEKVVNSLLVMLQEQRGVWLNQLDIVKRSFTPFGTQVGNYVYGQIDPVTGSRILYDPANLIQNQRLGVLTDLNPEYFDAELYKVYGSDLFNYLRIKGHKIQLVLEFGNVDDPADVELGAHTVIIDDCYFSNESINISVQSRENIKEGYAFIAKRIL